MKIFGFYDNILLFNLFDGFLFLFFFFVYEHFNSFTKRIDKDTKN